MMDRFTTDILFIVIVLFIAAILGFLIGYLLGKSKNKEEVNETGDTNADKLNEEIERLGNYNKELEQKNTNLFEELTNCKRKSTELSKQIEIQPKIKESEQILSFDAQAAKEILGKKIKADDLKIVEGIGPKIESIFKNNNIDSWYKLANQNADDLMNILLKDGGDSYRIHNPKTWPQQSLLAFEGKWEELKQLQDQLTGGKV